MLDAAFCTYLVIKNLQISTRSDHSLSSTAPEHLDVPTNHVRESKKVAFLTEATYHLYNK